MSKGSCSSRLNKKSRGWERQCALRSTLGLEDSSFWVEPQSSNIQRDLELVIARTREKKEKKNKNGQSNPPVKTSREKLAQKEKDRTTGSTILRRGA